MGEPWNIVHGKCNMVISIHTYWNETYAQQLDFKDHSSDDKDDNDYNANDD